MKRRLILASASPRRKELLKEAGFSDFEIVVPNVDEIVPDEENYYCAALDNALLKARSVAALNPDAIVIGSDTLIEFEKSALGKPASMEDAHKMLANLSGKTHCVASGVAVICNELDLTVKFTERSTIKFKHLSDEVIEDYLSKVHVLDKAGSYAVQEHGDMIIESVEGSLSNVIGLPVERLKETLDHVLSI